MKGVPPAPVGLLTTDDAPDLGLLEQSAPRRPFNEGATCRGHARTLSHGWVRLVAFEIPPSKCMERGHDASGAIEGPPRSYDRK